MSVGGPDSYGISEWDLQILKTSFQLTGILDTASSSHCARRLLVRFSHPPVASQRNILRASGASADASQSTSMPTVSFTHRSWPCAAHIHQHTRRMPPPTGVSSTATVRRYPSLSPSRPRCDSRARHHRPASLFSMRATVVKAARSSKPLASWAPRFRRDLAHS